MPLKTVLLVEPDLYHHDILSQALEHHGYAVVAVPAEEMPDVVGGLWRPDLVVVAFPARFEDGRSVFDWIRESEVMRDIPVLCVSEKPEPWDLDKALQSGCAAVCVKPLDAGHFVVQVRQLVGPSIPG